MNDMLNDNWINETYMVDDQDDSFGAVDKVCHIC